MFSEERIVSAGYRAAVSHQKTQQPRTQMGRQYIFKLAKCICSVCTGPNYVDSVLYNSNKFPDYLPAHSAVKHKSHLVTVNY